jgi:hypothetical protein
MHRLLPTLIAVLTHSVMPALAQLPEPLGCYRADRALGTSYNTAFGRGVPGPIGRQIGEDSVSLDGLRTFRIRERGRVDRPEAAVPQPWARGSRWLQAGDTLRIMLSTGLVGWQLYLTQRNEREYQGIARYLTDVVVKDGREPLQVPITVRRAPCAPAT